LQFIYHQVPKAIVGKTLIPLKLLRDAHPEIYDCQIKKYDDHPERKKLPDSKILKLRCTRGDVLHFSSLHPHKIYLGYKSVFESADFEISFFQIPITKINGIPAVYLDVSHEEYEFGVDSESQDPFYELITPETYKELDLHPERNLRFYKAWKAEGKKGAPLYPHIPHVMVKGPIDVDDCKVIQWSQPI